MPYLTKEQMDSGKFDDYLKNELPKAYPEYHKASWEADPEYRKRFGDEKEQALYAPEGFNQGPEVQAKDVAPERNIFGDIGSNLARGVSDAAKMGGYALKSLDPDGGMEVLDPIGQGIIDLSKKADKLEFLKPDVSEAAGEGFVKRGIMAGFRAAPLSIAAAGVGFIAGPAIGLGAMTGAAASTLGLFGLGTYGQKYQEFKDQGIEDEQAQKSAIYSGIVEGGFEALASYAGMKIFGVDKLISQPLKGSVKELLSTPMSTWAKRWAADSFLSEIPTEVIQSALGAEIETGIGLQDEGAWRQAALESIIPAMTMSILFGAGAAGMTTVQKRQMKSDLNNLDKPEARYKAVAQIEKGITENEAQDEDGEITKNAEAWANMALDKIDAGETIDLNESFVQYASQDEATMNGLRESQAQDNIVEYGNRLEQKIKNLSRFQKRTPRQEENLKNYLEELNRFNTQEITAKEDDEEYWRKAEQEISNQRGQSDFQKGLANGKTIPPEGITEAEDLIKSFNNSQKSFGDRIAEKEQLEIRAQFQKLISDGIPAADGIARLEQYLAGRARDKSAAALERRKQDMTKTNPSQIDRAYADNIDPLKAGMPPVEDMPGFREEDQYTGFYDYATPSPFAGLQRQIDESGIQATVKDSFTVDDGINLGDAEYESEAVNNQRNFQQGLNDGAFGIQDVPGADIDGRMVDGTREAANIEKDGKEKFVHDHTNTQVQIPLSEAENIRNFAAKIPESEIYTEPGDDSYGRENEPHITVKYGLKTNDPGDVAPIVESYAPVKARMGKVSIFENDKYDVVKVEIDSPELNALNKKIENEAEISLPKGESFDYTPHATIAYVKKGEGKKYVGDTTFAGKEIVFDEITVSTRDGKTHQIKLKGISKSEQNSKGEDSNLKNPITPTEDNKNLSSGKPVTWENKDGKTFVGKIIKPVSGKQDLFVVEHEVKGKKKRTQVHKSKNNLTEVEVLTEAEQETRNAKIDAMQVEVDNSETSGINLEKPNQPGDTIIFGASSPQWMRDLSKAWVAAGTGELGRGDLTSMLNAIKTNKVKGLGANQIKRMESTKAAIDSYAGGAGEFIETESAMDLEDKGFTLYGNGVLPVTDLNKGDKVDATIDGVRDIYDVKGINNDGDMVFQDGVKRELSIFDDVNIHALKKVDKKDQGPAIETPFGEEVFSNKMDEAEPESTDKAEPESTYGQKNTLVSSDRAKEIEALLKKKFSGNQLNSGFDPEIMFLGMELGVYHIEAGSRKFLDFSAKMVESLGEQVRPYLKAFYSSAKNWPGFDSKGMNTEAEVDQLIKQGEANVSSTAIDIERDSESISDGEQDRDENISGKGSEQGTGGTRGQGTGNGTGSQQPGTPGSKQGIADNAGADSNNQVYSGNEPAGSKGIAPGSKKPQGSNGSDGTGVPVDAKGKESSGNASNKSPVKFKRADLSSIKHDVPTLKPEQAEDVQFAEKRFADKNNHGILFTNGTGTGKTFTGLGIIKRDLIAGKKHHLVVVPSDKIAKDWVDTGKQFFDMPVYQLSNTQDNGKGQDVVVTTYANFYANDSLIKRPWDTITTDESHNLLRKDDFDDATKSLRKLRGLTGSPRGFLSDVGRWTDPTLYSEGDKIIDQLDAARKNDASRETIDSLSEQYKAHMKKQAALEKTLAPGQEEKWTSRQTKVTFLSATPFAYRKSIDYADGFLFNYEAGSGSQAYNTPSGKDAFFVSNFGYRMRYNKLTQPEADVDVSLMEREFNNKLRKEGAVKSRMLEVEQDYDRKFISVDGGIGAKIDEGLDFIQDMAFKQSEAKTPEEQAFALGAYDLFRMINKRLDYQTKAYMLEAIKAKAAVPIIKENINLGRKVVVFHNFNKGGGFNPFNLSGESLPKQTQAAYNRLTSRMPHLLKLDLADLQSPIETFTKAFGDQLRLFNGKVSKKDRMAGVKQFNEDNSGVDVILVQADAGGAGISLHDTTGTHQRVLFNLGMPVKPVEAIQVEGRVYRVNLASNTMFRYFSTDLAMERMMVASKLAERASTAENLAMGNQARGLKDAYITAYADAAPNEIGYEGEGTGGKASDRASMSEISDFDRAKTYYFSNQKKTSRTKSAEGSDYFATPEPLGLKMVEWAGIKPNMKVLEPSAGHGAIARWFPEDSTNHVVEPSYQLASRLAMNAPEARLHQEGFEDFDIVNKFDAIIMNPPFGSGGKTAIDHLAKAFKHLKANGRVVALIPEGPAANKKFDKWFESEAADLANIVATVDLPSVTFSRAGTGVKTRIIIIDKIGKGSETGQQRDLVPAISSTGTINDFFDSIENINIDRKEYKVKVSGKEVLDKAGLIVRKNENDDQLYEVAGTGTFANKEILKSLGAKWNKTSKAWSFDEEDPTGLIAAELKPGSVEEELQGDLFNQKKIIEMQPGLFSKKDLLKSKSTGTISKPAEKKTKKKTDSKQGDLFNEKPKQEGQLELFPVSVTGKVLSQPKGEGSGEAKKENKPGAKDRLEQTVRSGVKATGNIQHSGLVVNSDSDVASMLTELAYLPTESLYTVTVDKDGTIIEVYYYSKGGIGSSTANAAEIVGRSFTHKNAAKVYFVHNHPAGSTKPSDEADIPLTVRLNNLFKLKKMPSSNLILGRDENDNPTWGKFDVNGAISLDNPVQNSTKDTSVPVVEKAFLQTKRGPIVTPETLNDVLKNKGSGFLLLDSQMHEMGFLNFEPGMRQRDIASELLAALDQTNSTQFAPYNKEGDKGQRTKFFVDMATSFKSIGKNSSVVFTKEKGGIQATGIPKEAIQEIGVVDNAKAVFSTSQDAVGFKTIKDVKAKWDKKTSTLFLSEDANVVTVDSVIIPKGSRQGGVGTGIMNDVISYADSVGKRVELTPGLKDDRHGTTSRNRLVKFYKRFGFVENKGRNKDFEIGAGKMYREPVSKLSTNKDYNQQTPGQGVSLSEIQQAFPDQSVFISPDGSISVKYKNGSGVRIIRTNKISNTDTQFAIESGRMDDQGLILGKAVGNEITLNKDYADNTTLFHEIEHTLENSGLLTKAEMNILNNHFTKLLVSGKNKFKNNKDKAENRANAFSQLLSDRKEYRGTKIGAILQKIADFFDGLINIGRMSSSKLAREAETGKIFSREASQVNGENVKFQTIGNTETKAFKNWFGKSKVVDENGDPLVVYHGTGDDFTIFEKRKAHDKEGKSLGLGWGRGVFYFSSHPNVAASFATREERGEGYGKGNVQPSIKPVYLSAEKLFDAEKNYGRYQRARDGFKDTKTDIYWGDYPSSRNQRIEAFVKQLKKEGYDGIVFGEEYTVFEPTQIKSATGNNGNYDPNNPDIRYQTTTDRTYSPEQQEFKKVAGLGNRKKETYREKFDQAKVLAGTKLRQGMVDQFHSLRNILKDREAHMMATLTKSDTGVLMAAINNGMPIWDPSGAIDIKKDSKSLKEIFAPLGKELDDFLAWIAANRSEKLLAEDRENLLSPENIAAGKTLNQGTLSDGSSREALYDTVRKEFEEMGAAITDIAVKTNLVNEEEAQQWKEEGFYVPFYRMLEEQESGGRGPGNINGLTNQTAYKKLKGGKSQLDDLLTNTLLNWNHLISAGLRNQAGKRALESAAEMGLATVVPKAIKSKDAVYVRDNGQEVWYEIDQTPEGLLVLDSIMSLNYDGLNTPAMKIMRKFKRVLTLGVTASPGFKIRNLIRDSLHAPSVATVSKNPLKNIAIGFKEVESIKRMEAGGGGFSQEGYIHGNDPDAMKSIVGLSVDSILNTPKKIMSMWRKYEDFGNTLENINRVASFKNDLAKGKSLLEANFNARDQLDFSRSGSFSSVRVLTQVIPFLNARMQGLDKIGRAVMDPTQRNQFAQVVGMYTLASVGLMLAMAGDDDYDEAPEWEKRTYHLFKIPGVDTMFRIPRPFEVGAIAYMSEQMTRQFADENSKAEELGSALYHTLSDTFSVSVIPQAFKPMLEVYANKDSFRDTPIESMSMQNLSKKERSRPWTSDVAKGTSSVMSELLPEGATLSPVQIQHLVQAYTGWAGATTLASIDLLIKKINGEVTPETKLSEYTWNPVSSFAREGDAKSSKYVTQFYDNMSELNRMWADIQKYRGTPGGQKITADQIQKLRSRGMYNRYSKQLSDIRKQEAAIYELKGMSAEDKRASIKILQKRKNELTKRAVMITKDVF